MGMTFVADRAHSLILDARVTGTDGPCYRTREPCYSALGLMTEESSEQRTSSEDQLDKRKGSLFPGGSDP